MFRTILVPLDGSAQAERALPFAEALARRTGARVLLVQATSVRTMPGADPTAAQVRAVEQAQSYLDDLAARIARQGIAVETAVPYGPAVEGIVAEIQLRGVDLVVMTTHGRSGLGRWVYGSVAEGVLAQSPVPALLLQSWLGEQPWRRLAEQPRLLVPLDGSKFGEAALPVAVEFVRQFGGELVLLRAVPLVDQIIAAAAGPGVPIAGKIEDVEELRLAAQQYLEQVARKLAASLGQPPAIDVRLGEPAQAIAEATRERRADLVVMSTHGRTGLSRVVFGSVAGGVLRQASAPLLLVRPAALIASASPPASATTDTEVSDPVPPGSAKTRP